LIIGVSEHILLIPQLLGGSLKETWMLELEWLT
jgi:hypothetical protein